MPRNDRSDSFSVRADDDPRRLMKALQQETEQEFEAAEAHDSGGAEHQSAAERGAPAGDARRPAGASEPAPEVRPGEVGARER